MTDDDLCECGHLRRVHLDGSGRCCHCRCDRFDAEILDREGDMSEELRLAAEAILKPSFYVEARVGSENHRGECCRAIMDDARRNERADELLKKFARAYLAAADRPQASEDVMADSTPYETALAVVQYCEHAADGACASCVARVLRRYLAVAGRRADDGEPVTKEWLRAVRIKIGGYSWTYDVGFGFRITFAGDPCLRNDYGFGIANPTRGHVRRLCEALGIELPTGRTTT